MLAYKSTSEVVYFPDYKSVLEKKKLSVFRCEFLKLLCASMLVL